jgi:ABC-type hemin transport system substrate-binding protein
MNENKSNQKKKNRSKKKEKETKKLVLFVLKDGSGRFVSGSQFSLKER